jgi:hypothetical protein
MQHTWGSAYRVLVGKPEEKRPLGRPKLRWKYTIKMDIIKTGCGGIDWIYLALNGGRCRALVKNVMNLRIP